MRPVGLECYASEVTCRCRRTETRFVTRSTPEPRRQDRRRTGRGSDNDFRPESRGSSTQGPGKGVSDPDDCVEGTRLPAATSPSCVVMYEIEGLSVASIASLLGITAINQPIPGLLVAQVADSGRMIYLHPEIVGIPKTRPYHWTVLRTFPHPKLTWFSVLTRTGSCESCRFDWSWPIAARGRQSPAARREMRKCLRGT